MPCSTAIWEYHLYPARVFRCPVDPSVQFHHSGSPTVQRFSVRAFKFLGEHDFVFIHCRIYVCDANDPNSRCAQGCTRPQRGLKGNFDSFYRGASAFDHRKEIQYVKYTLEHQQTCEEFSGRAVETPKTPRKENSWEILTGTNIGKNLFTW